MKKIFTLIVLFSLGLLSLSKGQNVYMKFLEGRLGSIPVNNGITQSVTVNETLLLKLYNIGNEVYTGNLGLGVMITNDSATNQVMQFDSIYPIQQLMPADTANVGFNFYPSDPSLNLRVGGNVVVVWPKAANGLFPVVAADSLEFSLTLTDTANFVLARKYENRYFVYPNPTAEYLYFMDNENPADELLTVSIVESTGRVIRTVNNPGQRLSLFGLTAGTYSLQIETKRQKTYWIKVILK